MPRAIRASTHQNVYRASPIAIAPNASRSSYHQTQSSSYYHPNVAATMQSSNMQSQSYQMHNQNQMQLPSYATGGPVQPPSQNPYQTQSHGHQSHPSMSSIGGIPSRPSSGAWTPVDDNTLMQARAHGMNWAPIQATYFPSKTPNACRKRHERLMDRRNSDDWETEKLERMAKEYMAIRKDMWSMLAERTGEKWAVVEAKCITSGLKNLQSAARACTRRERLESGVGNMGIGGGGPYQHQHSYSTDHGAYTDDSGIGLDDLDLENNGTSQEIDGEDDEHGNGIEAETEYRGGAAFDPRHQSHAHHGHLDGHGQGRQHSHSHSQSQSQHGHGRQHSLSQSQSQGGLSSFSHLHSQHSQHPHQVGTSAYGVRPLLDSSTVGVGMRGSPGTDDGSSTSGGSSRGYDAMSTRGSYDLGQGQSGRVSSIDMGIGSIINRPGQGPV